MPFTDRTDAGRQLAQSLLDLKDQSPLILAFPRGGVVPAAQVATALGAPLDILAVRKIGTPAHPGLAVGAITEEGFYWLDHQLLETLGDTSERIHPLVVQKGQEVEAWIQKFRAGQPLADLHDRTVVLIDDGLATGVTAVVGARYLRAQGVGRLILAAPVAPRAQTEVLRSHFDEVRILETPEPFGAVSDHYRHFPEVNDDEVRAILAKRLSTSHEVPATTIRSREVKILVGAATLDGTLAVPPEPKGLVIFAHGSGSSRLSPRNRAVATDLQQRGLATLLFDLLSAEEARSRSLVFDIPLLARRLERATRWVREEAPDLLPRPAELPTGLFGASTGAAAALVAAADLGDRIKAVVSRGGRPDLAAPRLAEVRCPVLLLVGSLDEEVIELNREAMRQIRACKLESIPGASHLFEEPGTLEQVSDRAARFFLRSFRRGILHAA